jgi:hypothetical protein
MPADVLSSRKKMRVHIMAKVCSTRYRRRGGCSLLRCLRLQHEKADRRETFQRQRAPQNQTGLIRLADGELRDAHGVHDWRPLGCATER